MKLKIKKNLHISGTQVISYSTKVAQIVKGEIRALGRYTSTTTKHLNEVSRLTGLQLVSSQKSPFFNQYDYGVNCRLEDSISEKSTKIILGLLKEQSLCANLEEAVACSLHLIGKKDKERAIYQLEKAGYPEECSIAMADATLALMRMNAV